MKRTPITITYLNRVSKAMLLFELEFGIRTHSIQFNGYHSMEYSENARYALASVFQLIGSYFLPK